MTIQSNPTVTMTEYTTPAGEVKTVLHYRDECASNGTGVFMVSKYYHDEVWEFVHSELTLAQLKELGEVDLIAQAIIDNEPDLLDESTHAHWMVVDHPDYSIEGYYPLPKLIDTHPLLAGDVLTKLA